MNTSRVLHAVVMLSLAACGGSTPQQTTTTTTTTTTDAPTLVVERQSAPASGPARDIQFPAIARHTTANGLEVNTVSIPTLPIVHVRLVIKTGGEGDPANLPGLSRIVQSMLEEGTRSRTSVQLAQEVEELGADLYTSADEESIVIGIRALSSQLPDVLRIVGDVAQNPAFRSEELEKLRTREIDRLTLAENDPRYLANREFFKAIYGAHPYSRIDVPLETVRRVRAADLTRFHRTYFGANNAFLVVVGAVDDAQVRELVNTELGRWRSVNVAPVRYPVVAQQTARKIIVVHRSGSVQSVIRVGNLALARRDPAFVNLLVANQVLGGSAAARLFMDLRERRSLTYGAYSSLDESVEPTPFVAATSVRNEVTAEAVGGLFEHLTRIAQTAAEAEELDSAKRYLSDSFPLEIDTPGKVANLVMDLRTYGLPDDYFTTYRSAVRAVTAEQALEAARAHIRADHAVVVAVGEASVLAPALASLGEVNVIDNHGNACTMHGTGASVTVQCNENRASH